MAAAGRPMQGMPTNTATNPQRNGNRRGFVLPVRPRRATVEREQSELPRLVARQSAWLAAFVLIVFCLVRFFRQMTHTSRSPLVQKILVAHSTDDASSG